MKVELYSLSQDTIHCINVWFERRGVWGGVDGTAGYRSGANIDTRLRPQCPLLKIECFPGRRGKNPDWSADVDD